MISPGEIVAGGMRKGIQLNPLLSLVAALQDRIADLRKENSLAIVAEALARARRRTERVSTLFSRCEIARARAATEGKFAMTAQGCAFQLLRARNFHSQQLIVILQPFGGLTPPTEA